MSSRAPGAKGPDSVSPAAPAPSDADNDPRRLFAPPDLDPNLGLLKAHFETHSGRVPDPIRNYHIENPVSEEIRASAVDASVLVPIVEDEDGLRVLLTRRHHAISYPGQICFPGGRADAGDADAEETALRETREEIGLSARHVRILGRLGTYHTQSGYRITPVVGLIRPPFSLFANPREVDEILEIPLSALTRSSSYRIWRTAEEQGQAFFAMEHGDIRLTGPTVCLAMGFYEALARTRRSQPEV